MHDNNFEIQGNARYIINTILVILISIVFLLSGTQIPIVILLLYILPMWISFIIYSIERNTRVILLKSLPHDDKHLKHFIRFRAFDTRLLVIFIPFANLLLSAYVIIAVIVYMIFKPVKHESK